MPLSVHAFVDGGDRLHFSNLLPAYAAQQTVSSMAIPSPRGPSDKENGHDGVANGCKTNRARFQDMPYDVTKVIIEHTNPGDRYNLLFTCKVSPANDQVFRVLICSQKEYRDGGRRNAMRGSHGCLEEPLWTFNVSTSGGWHPRIIRWYRKYALHKGEAVWQGSKASISAVHNLFKP